MLRQKFAGDAEIEELIVKHFEEIDQKIYLKMLHYMDLITERFEVTMDLESNTMLFVQFLNEVGRDYFYGFVRSINRPSPIVDSKTRKSAFEDDVLAVYQKREKEVEANRNMFRAIRIDRASELIRKLRSVNDDLTGTTVEYRQVAAIMEKSLPGSVTHTETKRVAGALLEIMDEKQKTISVIEKELADLLK